MNFVFSKGQRLVVELSNNEMFEGDYESGTENRIDMVNVMISPKGTKVKGLLSYYRTEITDVKLLYKEVNEKEVDANEPQENGEPQNVIRVHRAEFERLEQMTRNYIYMATMDKRYLDAVKHLNDCETISVAGLGSELGRMRTLSLLVLCSWDQVYIFDLFSFRQQTFAPELRDLLESNSIKKVVHDVRALADCLWHCHGVTMKNVFDTQVADMKLQTDANELPPEKIRSLGQCLTNYLNFPSSLLEEATNICCMKWDERPLNSTQKPIAALLATYLITLKCELENLMLRDFYAVVKSYSQVLKSADAYTARMNLQNDKVSTNIQELLIKSKKCS